MKPVEFTGVEPIEVRVECYAGYRGEETPRRFRVGERPVEVAEVLDRWLAPDHRYFKVRGDDGDIYVLRQEAGTQRWLDASRDADVTSARPSSHEDV